MAKHKKKQLQEVQIIDLHRPKSLFAGYPVAAFVSQPDFSPADRSPAPWAQGRRLSSRRVVCAAPVRTYVRVALLGLGLGTRDLGTRDPTRDFQEVLFFRTSSSVCELA